MKTEAETLNKMINIMEEALMFYADPSNWTRRTSGHGESSLDVIKNDGGYFNCAGEKAREALAKVGLL